MPNLASVSKAKKQYAEIAKKLDDFIDSSQKKTSKQIREMIILSIRIAEANSVIDEWLRWYDAGLIEDSGH